MSNPHVLLVEDNPISLEVGRAMIEAFGCRVDSASNGLAVLDLIKTTSYDIVFMDCRMPLMDGFEATRLIREFEKEHRSRRTVIIALTGHNSDEDRDACIAAGMDDHLGKPFRMHDFSNLMEKWRAAFSSGGTKNIPEGAESNSVLSEKDAGKYLDQSRLDNIKALGSEGPELLSSLIDIYLIDTPLLIDKLSEAYESGDAACVATAAHTLKSSSASLGADVLGSMFKRIEDAALNNSIDGLDASIVRIRSEYEKVKIALERERQKGLDG